MKRNFRSRCEAVAIDMKITTDENFASEKVSFEEAEKLAQTIFLCPHIDLITTENCTRDRKRGERSPQLGSPWPPFTTDIVCSFTLRRYLRYADAKGMGTARGEEAWKAICRARFLGALACMQLCSQRCSQLSSQRYSSLFCVKSTNESCCAGLFSFGLSSRSLHNALRHMLCR